MHACRTRLTDRGVSRLAGMAMALLAALGSVVAVQPDPASASEFGTTVAGGNGTGSSSSQLNTPTGVAVDAAGFVYVADTVNDRVQRWRPGAMAGVTVAGGNGTGAAANQLDTPWDVEVDSAGNVYVSDSYNDRVQRWAPGATIGVTVAGGNGTGAGAQR
jgi:sugar lactone lactonase YvrE